MDLKTGELLWSQQMTENDAFNTGCTTPQLTNCPDAKGPDFDFGQPPDSGLARRQTAGRWSSRRSREWCMRSIPTRRARCCGRRARVQGDAWAAASGALHRTDRRSMSPSPTSDSAARRMRPCRRVPAGARSSKGGGLHALDLKTGKIVWSAKPSPCAAGDTVLRAIRGGDRDSRSRVLRSVDGHLRAYSTATGEVLWDVDTAREFETVNGKPARGGSMDVAGPAVVNGMVFVNSGYGQWGGMPGNVLLVFSVDGK